MPSRRRTALRLRFARIALAAVAIVAAGLLLGGCVIVDKAVTGGTVVVNGATYANDTGAVAGPVITIPSDASVLTIDLTGTEAHLGQEAKCATSVTTTAVADSPRARAGSVLDTFVSGQTTKANKCIDSPKTLRIDVDHVDSGVITVHAKTNSFARVALNNFWYEHGDVAATIRFVRAATEPTARLVVRATPTPVSPDAGKALWREVDARTSTIPGGGALTYSWDLNGDGVYGDASDPAASVPAGVAVVPAANLTPGTPATVGVRVTNAAGASSTATATLTPVAWGDTGEAARKTGEVALSSSTPTAGATVTATIAKHGYGETAVACVDADGDGTYETTVPFPAGHTLDETVTTTFTALAAGPHVVTTKFVINVAGPSTCTMGASSVFRAVYVATAAAGRRGAATSRAAPTYASRTTVTLSGGTVRKAPRYVHGEVRGEIISGHYDMPTRAHSATGDRPAALARFVGGRYVQRIVRLATARFGRAARPGGRTSLLGSGTMLLQATDGSLLCLDLSAQGAGTYLHRAGGTGSGRSLDLTLVGAPLSYVGTRQRAFGISTNALGQETQTRATRRAFAVRATAGAAKRLPARCRALRPYLNPSFAPPVTG